MPSEMKPLKNCPFCGNEAVLVSMSSGELKAFQIGCKTVGCRCDVLKSPAYMIRFNAVELWNRRAKP